LSVVVGGFGKGFVARMVPAGSRARITPPSQLPVNDCITRVTLSTVSVPLPLSKLLLYDQSYVRMLEYAGAFITKPRKQVPSAVKTIRWNSRSFICALPL